MTSLILFITTNNIFLEKKRNYAKGDSSIALHPWYVTGFTDGEGSFGIRSIKTNTLLGYKFGLEYKVTQKADSAGVLYDLQQYFNCGSVVIDNRTDNTLKFHVMSVEDITSKILPHFNQYPLVTSKQLNYLDFRKVAIKLNSNEQSLTKGVNDILEIKAGMNKGRKYEDKWLYLAKLSFNLDPQWVLAFIDGEGTWYVDAGWSGHNTRSNPYYYVRPGLEIAQSSHDILVLNALKSFFGSGSLTPAFDLNDLDKSKTAQSVCRFKLRNPEPLITFMENKQLLTRKDLDYKDWLRIVELKNKKTHLTEEGRRTLLELKSGMNRGRK